MSKYNDEYKKYAERQLEAYREELKFVLDGDVEGLKAHHGLEEGEEGIFDFINNLNNHDKFTPVSGFRLNKDFGVETFNDDNAYIVFDRGSECKWIVGQYGQVYMTTHIDKFRIEPMGNDFENTELYEYFNGAVGYDFENFKLEIDEDELNERLKDELRVDSAAEWLLEEARHYDTPVVTFKEFVECLQATDYDADEAVRKILDDGWHNVCDVDGIDFTKEDFLQDINAHIETIQKLKDEHDDWENVMSVFGVDEYNLSNFDEDMVEDELNENFPEQDEPEVKNKRKPKP